MSETTQKRWIYHSGNRNRLNAEVTTIVLLAQADFENSLGKEMEFTPLYLDCTWLRNQWLGQQQLTEEEIRTGLANTNSRNNRYRALCNKLGYISYPVLKKTMDATLKKKMLQKQQQE